VTERTESKESAQARGPEHVVVVNDEDQFSVWPAALPVPPGWRQVGSAGSEDECLDWIGAHWTDLRPASVRSFIEDCVHAGTRSW
jgi:MbtH protein